MDSRRQEKQKVSFSGHIEKRVSKRREEKLNREIRGEGLELEKKLKSRSVSVAVKRRLKKAFEEKYKVHWEAFEATLNTSEPLLKPSEVVAVASSSRISQEEDQSSSELTDLDSEPSEYDRGSIRGDNRASEINEPEVITGQDNFPLVLRSLLASIPTVYESITTISSQSSRMVAELPNSSSRDAPKFEDTNPSHLPKYLTQVEEWITKCGITGEQEKKDVCVKYADYTSQQQWKALENYEEGKSYQDFVEELMGTYPECRDLTMSTLSGLENVCRNYRSLYPGDYSRVMEFHRRFKPLKKNLMQKGMLSNLDLVERWFQCLDPGFKREVLVKLTNEAKTLRLQEDVDAIRNRLSIAQGEDTPTLPATRPMKEEDQFTIEEVMNATVEISRGVYVSQGGRFGTELYSGTPKGTTSSNYGKETKDVIKLEHDRDEWMQALASTNTSVDLLKKNVEMGFREMGSVLKQIQTTQATAAVQQPVQLPSLPRQTFPIHDSARNMCWHCMSPDHRLMNCPRKLEQFAKRQFRFVDGQPRLGNGEPIPNDPPGASTADKIDKYYANKRESNLMIESEYPAGMYAVNLQSEMGRAFANAYPPIDQKDTIISDLIRQNQMLMSQMTSNTGLSSSRSTVGGAVGGVSSMRSFNQNVIEPEQSDTGMGNEFMVQLAKELARQMESNVQTRGGRSSIEERIPREDFQGPQ